MGQQVVGQEDPFELEQAHSDAITQCGDEERERDVVELDCVAVATPCRLVRVIGQLHPHRDRVLVVYKTMSAPGQSGKYVTCNLLGGGRSTAPPEQAPLSSASWSPAHPPAGPPPPASPQPRLLQPHPPSPLPASPATPPATSSAAPVRHLHLPPPAEHLHWAEGILVAGGRRKAGRVGQSC